MTDARFGLRAATCLLLHGPAAYALTFSPLLGVVRVLAIVLCGLKAALNEVIALVVCALGYVDGPEIVCRMTGTMLPWEFWKYASVFIAKAAMAAECSRQRLTSPREARRHVHQDPLFPSAPRRWSWEPVTYFVSLVPAAIPTLMQLN